MDLIKNLLENSSSSSSRKNRSIQALNRSLFMLPILFIFINAEYLMACYFKYLKNANNILKRILMPKSSELKWNWFCSHSIPRLLNFVIKIVMKAVVGSICVTSEFFKIKFGKFFIRLKPMKKLHIFSSWIFFNGFSYQQVCSLKFLCKFSWFI